ncbi:hypothetical protein Efla_004037 [Eimeria flavescens]
MRTDHVVRFTPPGFQCRYPCDVGFSSDELAARLLQLHPFLMPQDLLLPHGIEFALHQLVLLLGFYEMLQPPHLRARVGDPTSQLGDPGSS